MKYLQLFLLLVLMLSNQSAQAKSNDNFAPNNLPAPAWIEAVNITSSSIHVKWAAVPGAVQYKLSRFDVTHNVQLPDVFLLEPEYVSEPHDPGTTISFEARGVDANGVVGDDITEEYTTTIIVVDDIANFTIPNSTQGNFPVSGNGSTTFGFTNADKNTSTVVVQRYKVKVNLKGTLYYAEVLLWATCSDGQHTGARLRYWNMGSWENLVSKTENTNANGQITSITFKVKVGPQEQPFFTLQNATYTAGTNGSPNLGDVTLHNDRSEVIYFEKSSNEEQNPCFVPSMGVDGGQYYPEEAISDEDIAVSDRAEAQITSREENWTVHPNPFATELTAQYQLQEESPVSFLLMDGMGKSIITLDLPILQPGTYSTTLQTSDLPPGIYVLALQTSKGRTMHTLVRN